MTNLLALKITSKMTPFCISKKSEKIFIPPSQNFFPKKKCGKEKKKMWKGDFHVKS